MKSRALFLCLLLGGTGCSWIGMTRPPEPPVEPSPPVTCTTSRLAPSLDLAGAVIFGVPGVITSVYGIAAPVCSGWCLLEPQSGADKAAIISVGLVMTGIAVAQAFAAADGYGSAARCEEVKAWQLGCVSGVEPSCAALRKLPPKAGKAPGERCEADAECREGNICYIGHCQVGDR
jgi:hypothetical protein